MFIEQAFLLWIRRTSKLTDVLDYINSIQGVTFEFTQAQKDRLNGYLQTVKDQKDVK